MSKIVVQKNATLLTHLIRLKLALGLLFLVAALLANKNWQKFQLVMTNTFTSAQSFDQVLCDDMTEIPFLDQVIFAQKR